MSLRADHGRGLGHPRPGRPLAEVRAIRDATEDADALVFGHTHKPWVHDYGGVRFINCGSVGKPKDGDPRGAFAILTPDTGALVARIERVNYDAERVADEVRHAGLPTEYADKLLVAT